MFIHIQRGRERESPVLSMGTPMNELVRATDVRRFTGSAVASDCPGPRPSRRHGTTVSPGRAETRETWWISTRKDCANLGFFKTFLDCF